MTLHQRRASLRLRDVTGAFDVLRPMFRRFLGSLSLLARNNVGGIPLRPVVLRTDRFVLVMSLLCFLPKLGQSRVLISWSTQLLPSGSLNDANVP